MARVGLLAVLLITFLSRDGQADCVAEPARPATFEIDHCSDQRDGDPGTFLLGSPSDDKILRVLVPSAEKLRCSKIEAGTVLKGDLEITCSKAVDATLTNVTIASPRSIKQMTRAQLEAEVKQLRADKSKLRTELRAWARRHYQEMERLKRDSQRLNTKLRD